MTTYHFSPRAGRYLRCFTTAACRYGTRACHLTAEQYALVESGKVYDRETHVGGKSGIKFAEWSLVHPNASAAMKEFHIAPAGVRGGFCFHCNHYFTEAEYQSIMAVDEQSSKKNYDCVYCNQSLRRGWFGIDMRYEEARLLDDDTCRDTSWFHATDLGNWFEDINQLRNGALPLVHLGTREAAADRMRNLHEKHAQTSSDALGKEYYLFEVQVKPQTSVAPGITVDLNCWPKNTTQARDNKAYSCFSAEGITRYLNGYEAPGSVSLLANPSVLVKIAAVKVPLT